MTVLRIVANLAADEPETVAAWYHDVFGLDVVMDHGWIVTLGGGQQDVQLSFASQGGGGTARPAISVEVDDLDDVIARAGAAVVYGPADEEWGVRRVYLRDPQSNLVNVLSHKAQKDD